MKVVRAFKLLKMDFLGASDPYVKLHLSGERLPAKRTTVKRKTLNPEWNENFKFIVRDPHTQVLELHVYDWDKVISPPVSSSSIASYKGFPISSMKLIRKQTIIIVEMIHRKSREHTWHYRTNSRCGSHSLN